MNKIYELIHWILIFIHWLLIIRIIFKIIMRRYVISSSIAWLLIIYLFPSLSIIIYLLFGELHLDKHRIKISNLLWSSINKKIKNSKNEKYFSDKSSKVAQSLFKLCEHRQGIKSLKCNSIKLIDNINNIIESLTNDINLSRKSIEIIFYIWHNGGIVDLISNSIIRAAKRGVRCRLILDYAGSINFFRSSCFIRMKAAGIQIVKALDINLLSIFLRRIDLRQHRKIILIDNCIAYTGSMNMVDPFFFKKNVGVGQWIDIMVRIEGPIVHIMNTIFSCDWAIETGENMLSSNTTDLSYMNYSKINNNNMHIIASGPGLPEGIIHQAILTSIYSAHKQIVITTPYLVPSDDLLNAICTAAQRGVDVHIIIPRHNDSILVNWASRVFFDELLKSGVFIHQFENGLLHSKIILIDNQLSLIGTFNLDMRSLWLNLEVTLAIDGYDFAKKLLSLQKKYIANSSTIKLHSWLNRPYWQRVLEKIFYFISPLL